MDNISLRGTISNIRYVPTYTPTYQFIVNGQFCTYTGSLPLEIGDYVMISGRQNDLEYTNNMGIKKCYRQVVVTSISVL